MLPEMPYLAAGALAITGGAIREHKLPANTGKAVVGTVALVIVASATTGTRIAPLVHALGLLLLLTAVITTVKAAGIGKKHG
jgi:dolichol kinase